MKESQIEARLVQGVKALGGRAYKFVSPGNVGVPDRVVILPGGKVLFVELKAENGRLSRMQSHQIEQLHHLGAEVWVIWGDPGIQVFLEHCTQYIKKGSGAK